MNTTERVPGCFIACFVHPHSAQTIARQVLGLGSKAVDLRWTQPQDYHVTLRYFGDLESQRSLSIAADLALLPATVIECEGLELVGFPQSKRARAMVVVLREHRELRRWYEDFRVIPEPADRRPFMPHVTVARSRGNMNKHLSDAQTIQGLHIKLSPPALYHRANIAIAGNGVYRQIVAPDLDPKTLYI